MGNMEAIDFVGPEQQARHLARYISCPSTIRAHCINNWGRSPDVMQIKAWQAPKRTRAIAEPKDTDALQPRIGILPVAKPKPVKVAKVVFAAPKPPKAGLKPWPKWYIPPARCFIASDLIASVAEAFRMTPADITGDGREQRFVHARAVVVRIMRDRGWSFPRIGRVLGGRDHSTTINAASKFDIYARQNDQVVAVYQAHRDAGWCGNAA